MFLSIVFDLSQDCFVACFPTVYWKIPNSYARFFLLCLLHTLEVTTYYKFHSINSIARDKNMTK